MEMDTRMSYAVFPAWFITVKSRFQVLPWISWFSGYQYYCAHIPRSGRRNSALKHLHLMLCSLSLPILCPICQTCPQLCIFL